ncbi:hypothetical protein J15TS10_17070 [Paenibacillus woosongensis]|uniref:Uncharacterized protein n=1 Tax=Paenibacillus woosongensis TaxID=307580 RepID=A0ABQ4MPM2_9BACL|nr:hypothetical protein J15TS10_17070 [Paenibacillus woosongensis]
MTQYALEHPYLTAFLITVALLVISNVLNNLIIAKTATKRGDDDADSGTKSN